MDRSPRRHLVPSALLALAVALTGCAEDDPGDSMPTSADAALTQEQAEDALLTVDDLPDGWSTVPEGDDTDDTGGSDDDDQVIDPARCESVLDAVGTDVEDADVEADVAFTRADQPGTLLSETVTTYPDDVEPDFLDSIEDAFAECPSFTSTDPAGEVSRVSVSPLSLPDLGDRRLAVSTTYETPTVTVTYDLAFVVAGPHLLVLVIGGVGDADDELLADTAEAAVAELVDATS